MELDFTIREDRIAADGGAAIIEALDITGGQNRHNARKTARGLKIKPGDFPLGALGGIARRHMQAAIRLAHVVDVGGRALHMQLGTVMGEGLSGGHRAHAAPNCGMSSPRAAISALRNRFCATSMR